jgi:hypothetical protein
MNLWSRKTPPVSLGHASPPIPRSPAVLPLDSPSCTAVNRASHSVLTVARYMPSSLGPPPLSHMAFSAQSPSPCPGSCLHCRPSAISLAITAVARTSHLRTRVYPGQLNIQSLSLEPASCRPPHRARSCITSRVAPVPNRAPAPPDWTDQGLSTASGCALHFKAPPPYHLSPTADHLYAGKSCHPFSSIRSRLIVTGSHRQLPFHVSRSRRIPAPQSS